MYQLNREPKTKQDGLANALKMAFNHLAADDIRECGLQLQNIIDDVISKSNPYHIGGKPRLPKENNYRGDVNVD